MSSGYCALQPWLTSIFWLCTLPVWNLPHDCSYIYCFFLFFFIYFPISFWVILKSYRFTKEKYRRGWVGGFISAFIMYNLVFWDWIPVILIHKRLCETEGGFWVYKTPEQWVREHPEVKGQDWGDQSKWKYETFDENYKPDKGYYREITRSWISPWLYLEHFQPKNTSFIGSVYKTQEKLIDIKSGEVLARSINFGRSGQYKFWLNQSPDIYEGCGMNPRNGVWRETEKLIQLVKGDKK